MPERGEVKTVGNKPYEWDGRRWVPASEQSERGPISTKRSRYSQGAPRPARDPKPAEESVTKERTGRDTRRGGGVRGRGPENPVSFSPTIRGRSGAKRGVGDDNSPKTPPTPQAPDTDRSERVKPAPDGNGSTGTNTGFKGEDRGANGLLARLGITTTRYGDFQSNDLPGVENTEYGGSDREIFGGTAEEDRIIQGGGSLETVIDAKQTQGSPKLTQSGDQSITSTVEIAPLGSLQRYGQEFMQDRPDMPADKSTSMTGLRAAEASKGLLYASGKYWKENPNAGKEGEKDFIEIQKDEWNSIKRGEQHAQEFLQQKMGPVKSEISLTDKQDDYQISDASKPISSIDSTAQVEPSQITNAPTLTDAVDVSFTDKDRTGRYNLFRRS